MNIYWVTIFIIFSAEISCLSAFPFTDDDGDNFSSSSVSDEDARRRRKNKRRPCQRSEDQRTFFQLSYVDVNYNYNCGNTNGDVSSHSIQRPLNRPHNKPHNRPNHNRPNHNRPSSNNNNEEPLQQEEGNDPVQFSTTRRPHRPLGNFIMNHNGAFLQNFISNLFGNNQKVESKPIPVHEDIINDETTKYEPGLYVNAYNPLTGQYTQSNITNPKRIYRRINKGIDFLLSPIYDLI